MHTVVCLTSNVSLMLRHVKPQFDLNSLCYAQCNVSKVHSFDAELHLVTHSECSFWLNPNQVSLKWNESAQISLLSCIVEEWCVIRRTMCPDCQRAFCRHMIHFWWVMLNYCRAHVNVTLMQTTSTLDRQVYQRKPENWGKLSMTQICIYLMLRGESIVLL